MFFVTHAALRAVAQAKARCTRRERPRTTVCDAESRLGCGVIASRCSGGSLGVVGISNRRMSSLPQEVTDAAEIQQPSARHFRGGAPAESTGWRSKRRQTGPRGSARSGQDGQRRSSWLSNKSVQRELWNRVRAPFGARGGQLLRRSLGARPSASSQFGEPAAGSATKLCCC